VSCIGTNIGSPSYCTVSFASERVMVAVCGIELAINASLASGVPGTDARTIALGLFVGILAKSGGISAGFTKVQGPSRALALNQRPDIRM
jgi:hypothetical protein